MEIVKPKPNELDRLLDLWQEQYEYHNKIDPIYYVPNSVELNKKFKEYLVKAIKKDEPHILIAKQGMEIMGFVTFEKGSGDYFDTNITRYGEVIELLVSEKYRERDVGKKLMCAVEKYFRENKIEFIKIQCSTHNINALNFYQHSGYENRQTLLYKRIKS